MATHGRSSVSNVATRTLAPFGTCDRLMLSPWRRIIKHTKPHTLFCVHGVFRLYQSLKTTIDRHKITAVGHVFSDDLDTCVSTASCNFAI